MRALATIKANYNIDRSGNGDFDTYYFSTAADIVKIIADNDLVSDDVLQGLKEILNRAFFNADDLSKLKVYKYSINHSGQKTVDVPLPAFDRNLDTIVLFLNSSIMIKGKDYTLSQTSGNVARITFTKTPVGEIDYLILRNLIPSTNANASKLLQTKVNACISYEITSPAFSNGANSYEIPVGFDIGRDFLLVSANSVMYSLGVEYSLNYRSNKWFIDFTRPREAGETIDLILFKNVFFGSKNIASDGTLNGDVKAFLETNSDTAWVRKFDVNITTSNRSKLNIPDLKFNKLTDSSLLFVNSTILIEDKDYVVNQRDNNRATFEFINPLATGRTLEIMVFKNALNTKDMEIDFSVIEDNIIPTSKVNGVGNPELLETANKVIVNAINEILEIVNAQQMVSQEVIGDVNLLQTNSKVIVDAINELILSQATVDFINAELDKKVDKVQGMGLSQENFTNDEKFKLSSIEPAANHYVHPNNAITRHVTDTQISSWNEKSNLALGETSATAYRGDRGKTAYDHSQTTHAPSNAQKNSDITKDEIEAKLTGTVTTHTHNASALVTNASNRLVTDSQISNWNSAHTMISRVYTSRPSSRPVGTMWIE